MTDRLLSFPDNYRREFQPAQGGRIGIANNAHWPEPKDDSPDHVAAARRDFDFMPGWFTDPVVFGDDGQLRMGRGLHVRLRIDPR